MQTPKEALLARMSGEKADYITEMWSSHKNILFPGEIYQDFENFDPYGTGTDAWGVVWQNCGPNPEVDGLTVLNGFRLFENMDEWKEKVKFPVLDETQIEAYFNHMREVFHIDPESDAVFCLLLQGQFERLHSMIGMENALCAFYEYPDEMHEFMEAMCEYKLKCIELAHKYLKPDVIHMHDDWGMNDNMFFPPEIWREFIKPNEKRYAKRIHELGMLYMHHSCGYIQQIIPDLIEIGVDTINPMMVQNDIDFVMDKYGDKITIAGGLDNQMIEAPGTTEEEIRQEIRTKMDKYVNKGRYLPFMVATTEDTLRIYKDEVTNYGKQIEMD